MNGFLAILSPPGDGIDRSVLFSCEQDSRGDEIISPLAVRNHVIKSKGLTFPVKDGALCRPANIGPLPVADDRLKIDAIKLAVPKQDNLSPFGYQSLYLYHQVDVDGLGQVSLCLSHDRPGYGQNLFAIDNPYIESDAATPRYGPVNHKNQRVLSKRPEKSAGCGQEIGFTMLPSIVDPSRQALFPTGRASPITHLLGDFRQLCAAACHDCTDKRCKRGEVLGLAASDTRHELLKRGHNGSKGFL